MVCLPVEIGRLSIFYLRSVQFYPNTSMFLASSEGINGLSALFVKESDTKFAMEWWWVRFIQHSASSSSSCCFRLQTPGRNLESKKGNLENTTSVSKRQQTSVSPSVDRFDLPKLAPATSRSIKIQKAMMQRRWTTLKQVTRYKYYFIVPAIR